MSCCKVNVGLSGPTGHFELWIKDPMSNQGSENGFILSLGTPPYEELAIEGFVAKTHFPSKT